MTIPLMRPTRELPTEADERAVHSLCLALLRVGFTEPYESPRTLVRSYRTVAPLPVTDDLATIGPSAVSLCCTSVRSPQPGSRQHSALWSPDFPRHGQAVPRPPDRLTTADQCTARSAGVNQPRRRSRMGRRTSSGSACRSSASSARRSRRQHRRRTRLLRASRTGRGWRSEAGSL